MKIKVAMLTLLFSFASMAGVPFKIPYQGRLTQMDGTLVTGAQPFVFSIFVSATGGVPVWTEAQTLAVNAGLYSALLGDVSNCDGGVCSGIAASIFNSAEQYLEVSVGGLAMTPRQRIGSVPFAIQAHDVNGGTVNARSVSTNELRSAQGDLVIDSKGKYVGPAIVSAGNGILVSDAGVVSLPSCNNGQMLSQQDGGWRCTNVAPTSSLFYLCPDIFQCGNSSCRGQFSNTASCSYGTNNGGSNCNGSNNVACALVGRLLVAP